VVINDKKLKIKNWDIIRKKSISLMSKDEKDIILVIVLKNIWDLITKRNLQGLVHDYESLKDRLNLDYDNIVKIEMVNEDF